jgi:hypothetical protein
MYLLKDVYFTQINNHSTSYLTLSGAWTTFTSKARWAAMLALFFVGK